MRRRSSGVCANREWKRSCPPRWKCIAGAIARRKSKCRCSVAMCFSRCALSAEDRMRVYQVESVHGFVGMRGRACPFPMNRSRASAGFDAGRALALLPVFEGGTAGAGTGRGRWMEWRACFVSENGDHSLIISIDAIQRSMACELTGTTYSRSEVQYRSLKELLTFPGSDVSSSGPDFPHHTSTTLEHVSARIERIDDELYFFAASPATRRLRAQRNCSRRRTSGADYRRGWERKGELPRS